MAKYNTEIKDELLQYIRDGMSQKDAAAKAGVSVSQLHEWRNKHPEFAESFKKALKEARAKIVPELERALYKRALGYEYEERKVETFPDGNERVTITRKQMAPEVGALVFALCNLAPGDWRNKIENQVSGDLKTTVKVEVEDKETQKEIDKLGK